MLRSREPRRRRRKTLMIVALAVVVVAGVAFFAIRAYLAGGGETTAVPVDVVVRRYQEQVTATSAPATSAAPVTSAGPEATALPPAVAVLPASGVYVYATTGGDSIDIVGGVAHTYPATSTITVTAEGCGVRQRWDVADERWQSSLRCTTDAGVAEPQRVNYDEFFDLGQTDTWECTGEPRPLDAPPGTTWARSCQKGDHFDLHSGTVVGTEPIDVGGRQLQSLHVRVSVDNGRASDSQVTDSWYLLGSDLLLVQSAVNRTTNDTAFGEVHYEEDFEIRLSQVHVAGRGIDD